MGKLMIKDEISGQYIMRLKHVILWGILTTNKETKTMKDYDLSIHQTPQG